MAQPFDGGPSRINGRWSRALPWVILVLGLLGSVAVWDVLRAQDEDVVTTHFQLDAQERRAAIEDELTDALAVLDPLVSLFVIEPKVTRAGFRFFADRMRESNSSLAALGWNIRIRAEDREAHEAEGRSQGFSGYQITDRLAQGKMIRAAVRPEHVVVYYIEPYEGNENALGFDTASEEERLHALSRARDTGELSTTARVKLVQETGDEHGFLAFSPVYAGGDVPATIEERRRRLRGFLAAVFRVSGIVESALSRFDPDIELTLLDEDGAPGERLLYASSGDESHDEDLVLRDSIRNGHRTWSLAFHPTRAYMATLRSRAPLAALWAGFIVTLLLVSFLVVQQRRTEEIQRLVVAREHARTALRKSEGRLRLTLASIADGWWDWNLATNEVAFSESWLRAMGADAKDERQIELMLERIHPDDVEQEITSRTAHLEGRSPLYECEVRLRRGSGEYRWTRRRGRVVERDDRDLPRRMVGVDTDVTREHVAAEERRRLEEHARHTQKLESLGVLAGGIAHDFNNLLMAILGNADLAMLKLPEDSPLRPQLLQIHNVGNRAADLVRQMLAYAGKNPRADDSVDLAETLGEMNDLLAAAISKKAVLRFESAPDLPPVRGDASQLRQVFMNLIVNASEALEGKSGSIHVRCRLIRAEREQLEQMLGARLAPGPYVSVEVFDEGTGMDEETQTRIFDPFFTTKFQGRGLGLAATLGIVSSHGGAIRVDSSSGSGTTIQVLLPTTRERARPGTGTEHSSAHEHGARGIVLVTDDEEAVRNLTAEMVAEIGYEVITANDGVEAVEMFRAHADELLLVLLDYQMPRMDGKEAYGEMRRIRPDIPVLMASGFTQDMSVQDLGEAVGFLQKPYTVAELRRGIEAALGARRGREPEGTSTRA